MSGKQPKGGSVNPPHEHPVGDKHPHQNAHDNRIPIENVWLDRFGETRIQHILAMKHKLGHRELGEIKDVVRPDNLLKRDVKAHDNVDHYEGKEHDNVDHYEGELKSGKIIHVEVLNQKDGCRTVMDAWVPTRDCAWCKSGVGESNLTKDMKAEGKRWDQRNRVRRYRSAGSGRFSKDPFQEKNPVKGELTDYQKSCKRRSKSEVAHRGRARKEFQGVNRDGERFSESRVPNGKGAEAIHHAAEKSDRRGTVKKEYENCSQVGSPVGHSVFYTETESMKGSIFAVTRTGRAELDKENHTTRMVQVESEKWHVREEVVAAAAGGLERGGTQARIQNESVLAISSEAKVAALRQGLSGSAVATGTAACGLLAAEKLEVASGLPASATAPVVTAAIGAAASSCWGGSTSSVPTSAGEAMVPRTADQVAQACRDQVLSHAVVTGSGAALKAVMGTSAPVPTSLIREHDADGNLRRCGMNFQGNQYLSLGERERFGQELLPDGATAYAHQIEQGAQFRVSGSTAGAAVGATYGGMAGGKIGSAVGSLVGVSGNLGTTHRLERVEQKCGDFTQKEEMVRGFAGGADVVGVQVKNLDTGHVEMSTIEHRKTGLISSTTTALASQEERVLGVAVGHVDVRRTETSRGVIFETQVSEDLQTGDRSSTWAVKDEIKLAAASGVEMGGTRATRCNEQKLFLSASQQQRAFAEAGKSVAWGAAEGVGWEIAGEALEGATGKVLGSAASGVTSNVGLAALGAAVGSGGSGTDRAKAAGVAAMEVGTKGAAGAGLRPLAGESAPIPTGVICDHGGDGSLQRCGVEFGGNQYVSIGDRERRGFDVSQDGSERYAQEHESGTQFRISGSGIGRLVGASCGGFVGATIGAASGSLMGVGGNIGTTHRLNRTDHRNGNFTQKDEIVHGFAGGADVVGVRMRNLDTGHVDMKTIEHHKTGFVSSTTTTTTSEEGRCLGFTYGHQDTHRREEQKGVLLQTTLDEDLESGERKWSWQVKEEVRAAAETGAEVGGLQARRRNEGRVFGSAGERVEALKDSLQTVVLHAGAGVAGEVAGEFCGAAAGHSAVGGVVGQSAAAVLVAVASTTGDTATRAKAAASAGADAAIITAVSAAGSEAIGKVIGNADLAGGAVRAGARAISAAVHAEGGAGSRLSAAGAGAAEGAMLAGVGVALRACMGTAAPIPTGLIRQRGSDGGLSELGLEFAGGHAISCGVRARSLRQVLKDGTNVNFSNSEKGAFARHGFLCGLIGAKVKLGRQDSSKVEVFKRSGSLVSDERFFGASFGVDIVGLEFLDLRTGIKQAKQVETNELGSQIIADRRTLSIFGLDLIESRTITKILDWREEIGLGHIVRVKSATLGQRWLPARVVRTHRFRLLLLCKEGTDDATYVRVLRKSAKLRPLKRCTDPPVLSLTGEVTASAAPRAPHCLGGEMQEDLPRGDAPGDSLSPLEKCIERSPSAGLSPLSAASTADIARSASACEVPDDFDDSPIEDKQLVGFGEETCSISLGYSGKLACFRSSGPPAIPNVPASMPDGIDETRFENELLAFGEDIRSLSHVPAGKPAQLYISGPTSIPSSPTRVPRGSDEARREDELLGFDQKISAMSPGESSTPVCLCSSGLTEVTSSPARMPRGFDESLLQEELDCLEEEIRSMSTGYSSKPAHLCSAGPTTIPGSTAMLPRDFDEARFEDEQDYFEEEIRAMNPRYSSKPAYL